MFFFKNKKKISLVVSQLYINFFYNSMSVAFDNEIDWRTFRAHKRTSIYASVFLCPFHWKCIGGSRGNFGLFSNTLWGLYSLCLFQERILLILTAVRCGCWCSIDSVGVAQTVLYWRESISLHLQLFQNTHKEMTNKCFSLSGGIVSVVPLFLLHAQLKKHFSFARQRQ